MLASRSPRTSFALSTLPAFGVAVAVLDAFAVCTPVLAAVLSVFVPDGAELADAVPVTDDVPGLDRTALLSLLVVSLLPPPPQAARRTPRAMAVRGVRRKCVCMMHLMGECVLRSVSIRPGASLFATDVSAIGGDTSLLQRMEMSVT